MNPSRRVKLGVALFAGGLAALGIDTLLAGGVFAVPGLVLLLLVPPIVALLGSVVLLTALSRKVEGESRSQTFGRIVIVATVGGASLGLALLIEGTVALIPEWANGHTGMFGAGFGVGVGAFIEVGIGLAAGLAVGMVAASIWWLARGHLLPASPEHEVAPGTYPVPPVK